MAKIIPFRALRFATRGDSLSRSLCPPRDAVSAAQERALRREPMNAVHADMPSGFGAARRRAAAAAWKKWLSEKRLALDSEPSFYACEETFLWRGKTLRRTGFFAGLDARASAAADILAHEKTFSKPTAERLRLLKALRADTSAIFGLFADPDGLARRIFSAIRREKPIARARLFSVSYRLWQIGDRRLIRGLTDLLAPQKILIADGHHRWEAAKRYWKAARRGAAGDSARSVLAYLCAEDDPSLVVLPTHRVVPGRAWRERAAALCRMTRLSSLTDLSADLLAARSPYSFGFFDGEFFLAEPRQTRGCRSKLGVEWLKRFLLARVRRDGIRYTPEANRAVSWARAEKGSAILLKPFPARQIREAVDQIGLLPPKSTYFYPKIPAGLVFKSAV